MISMHLNSVYEYEINIARGLCFYMMILLQEVRIKQSIIALRFSYTCSQLAHFQGMVAGIYVTSGIFISYSFVFDSRMLMMDDYGQEELSHSKFGT